MNSILSGGGASTGIRLAIGREPDIAVTRH